MEDFDVFTDEINYTKSMYVNVLNKFVKEQPATPNGSNYQSARKLQAEECLIDSDDLSCAFHLSEAVSASFRCMATYRDEQLQACDDSKFDKIKRYVKPVTESVKKTCNGKKDKEDIFSMLTNDLKHVLDTKNSIHEDIPLHKRYLKFTPENNVENFQKILKELPKEWTILQLTAPYNPNENLKPTEEFKMEINALFLTVYTNDFLDDTDIGPINLFIPANVNKVGEKPIFTELYSLLSDNYKTIENAQYANTKRRVQDYWSKREDIDLRMKSVIMVMDREWLSGWNCMLTGKLVDADLKDRVRKLVNDTINDWGFVHLTQKQKILLYNLLASSSNLSSTQIKTGLRKILTEHGNTDDIRQTLDKCCQDCNVEFDFPTELCLKCLSNCFMATHHVSLVDGIKAFSHAARQIRDNVEWSALKTAKRYPVVLIVDEILDTFPWESLPVMNVHPVSRIENIHFLYYLYKVHEENIVNGYFQAKADVGRYVINPERNLPRMECRMSSFVKYWCPQWKGNVGEAPPPDDFLDYLKVSDLFLYCGHGDGLQLASGAGKGAGVEAAKGSRASAILAGCGSTRLPSAPGRSQAAGSHHHYHIAGSPMVIGMLWEVTDLEVDKVVSSLLAFSVPSSAGVPWSHVGKENWTKGVLDTNVDQKEISNIPNERCMLSAMAKARRCTHYVMIASSVVARGIPILIEDPK